MAIAGYIWSGLYNIAADEPHTEVVHSILETVRERSIAVRADDLQVPSDLDDQARIIQGSGNYAAMCTGCHLAPSMAETELSRGLYPAPPDLTRHTVDAAEAFWVIKHGIKASGMPAWGESMADEYVWNMAAFLQVLPTLDAAEYQAMVASSGGHSHGGGETQPHAHGEGAAPDHHGDPAAGASAAGGSAAHERPPGTPPHDDAPAGPPAGTDDHHGEGGEAPHAHPPGTPADHHGAEAQSDEQPQMIEHRHADGTVESHPAPQAPPADDGHDHEH
ncbi:c-type cytochrome [Coralloluteibacterium stylophorae]|uniref:C-type cytochrome n=1 Tax=Coralloluteibacterium stylophorae TaxID=1776034 RepID=A0A8J8AYD6_9GAMM|nr:cytochrome c [Coralloluteibacterium stylophorae]MBS7457912.1 c-type cytochrome [Coralloluteibacterium stylophorae]